MSKKKMKFAACLRNKKCLARKHVFLGQSQKRSRFGDKKKLFTILQFTIYNLFIYLQFIYLITIYQFINQLFINLLTI